MCTGSVFRDKGSGFRNGKYDFVYYHVFDADIGSPCRGDQGTSLMVMENERSCNKVNARQVMPYKIVFIVVGTRLQGFSANVQLVKI